jgi:hypothetical protein
MEVFRLDDKSKKNPVKLCICFLFRFTIEVFILDGKGKIIQSVNTYGVLAFF